MLSEQRKNESATGPTRMRNSARTPRNQKQTKKGFRILYQEYWNQWLTALHLFAVFSIFDNGLCRGIFFRSTNDASKAQHPREETE